MLDNLPPQVRHALIVFGSAFLGIFAKAIVDAGGVTGLAWQTTAAAALNGAVIALIIGAGLLAGTPLSRQYGIGATPTPPE
jgi:hypothetical protein